MAVRDLPCREQHIDHASVRESIPDSSQTLSTIDTSRLLEHQLLDPPQSERLRVKVAVSLAPPVDSVMWWTDDPGHLSHSMTSSRPSESSTRSPPAVAISATSSGRLAPPA
jgi:hypothetical protein